MFGSTALKISSSSTVGATCELRRKWPSGTVGLCGSPGVSSTKVSPSSVFWRRMARAVVWIGAYLRSISSVATVRLPFEYRSFWRTLPIVTPDSRTSASRPSWVASGNATLNW